MYKLLTISVDYDKIDLVIIILTSTLFNKMNVISVSKFKSSCLKLFDEIANSHKSLTITKRGNPIADVVPHNSRKSLKKGFGCMKGTAVCSNDIISPVCDENDWNALK